MAKIIDHLYNCNVKNAVLCCHRCSEVGLILIQITILPRKSEFKLAAILFSFVLTFSHTGIVVAHLPAWSVARLQSLAAARLFFSQPVSLSSRWPNEKWKVITIQWCELVLGLCHKKAAECGTGKSIDYIWMALKYQQ